MMNLDPQIGAYLAIIFVSACMAAGFILIGYGMGRFAARPVQPPKEKKPKVRDVKPTEDILDDPFSKAAMGIPDEEGIPTI